MYLCQVAPYVTYPPRMGGDHRTHGLVKGFPEAGDTVVRYCQGGSPAMYKSLDLRRTVEIADNYTEYRHLHPLHEIIKPPMLLGYPNLLASAALHLASDGLDDMFADADVVLVREPWQAPYVLDNADDDTPVIFSSHNVETERFGDIKQPLFESWTEERVNRLERRAVEDSDAIVCTSERDVRVYREKYDPGGPIIVAPNGTYENNLREHRPISKAAKQIRRQYDIDADSTVCLFMGSNYRPNVEAAEATVEVARKLDLSQTAIDFLIMGSVGNAFDNIDLPENVTTTGYVEKEFEAHFDAADIALNPMLSGGGTNIKLVDYFARSLPVVSTPFGVRGTDVKTGEHLLVATIDDFPHTIETLAANAGRRQELGEAARKLAAKQYTWESASRTLCKNVKDLFGPFEP